MDVSFAIKELASSMACPTTGSLRKLGKRLFESNSWTIQSPSVSRSRTRTCHQNNCFKMAA